MSQALLKGVTEGRRNDRNVIRGVSSREDNQKMWTKD